MEGILLIIITVGVILFFVLAYSMSSPDKTKRAATLRLMAAEMGFEFFETSDSLLTSLGNFELFSFGHTRHLKNIFKGKQENILVLIADYEYIDGHGRQRTTHPQTVFIIEDPEMRVPHFFLRRESRLFDFLGKIFGGQDINFAEDPQFSDAFVLQGKYEGRTRDFFDSDIRKGFVNIASNSNAHIEGRNSQILLHNGNYTDPEELTHMLKQTFDVYNLIKSSPRSVPNPYNNY